MSKHTPKRTIAKDFLEQPRVKQLHSEARRNQEGTPAGHSQQTK